LKGKQEPRLSNTAGGVRLNMYLLCPIIARMTQLK